MTLRTLLHSNPPRPPRAAPGPTSPADTPSALVGPLLAPDGTPCLLLSPDLAALLKIDPVAIRGAELLPWRAGPAARPKRETAVDFNIPEADRGFLAMDVPQLLGEYVEAALDVDRPESTDGVLWRDLVMGRIRFALQNTPSRQADLPLLANAYYALDSFLARLRLQINKALHFKPVDAQAIRSVSRQIAHEALSLALAVPLVHGEAAFQTLQYDGLYRLVPEAWQLRRSAVEWKRQGELARGNQETQAYFTQVAPTVVRGVGSRVFDEISELSRGEIVVTGDTDALVKTVRTVPAGRLSRNWSPPRGFYVKPTRPTYRAVYPENGWGQTLKNIWHQQADGNRTLVLVGLMSGVHSYSIDRGASWEPTGAAHSPALEASRADAWREFLKEQSDELSFQEFLYGPGFLRRPTPPPAVTP